MDSIPAIYDAGVFRPLEPVNLAEGTTPEPPAVWPPSYFDQTAGAFESDDLVRHPQGEFEVREPME